MSTKITELQSLNVATSDDLLVIVNNPGGTPATRHITVGDMFSNVTMNVAFNSNISLNGNTTVGNIFITYDTTPPSSVASVTKGKLWFDDNFLYVAIANNNIKRVALSSF